MNGRNLAWLLLLACSLLLLVCASGDACTRCRRSPCAFRQRVVHAPAVKVVKEFVQQPVYQPAQNIIFNNTYPAAQPGVTGYVTQPSYQQLAAPYQPTVSQFIELAKAGFDSSQALAQLAAGQGQVESGLAALREKNIALREQTLQIQAITSTMTTPASVTAVCAHRKQVAKVEQPKQSIDTGLTGVLKANCAKCHGTATPKGEFFFDGESPVSDETFRRVMQVLVKGQTADGSTMPPKGPLGDEQVSQAIIELIPLTKGEQ